MIDTLTKTEQKVLQLLLEGLSNKQIAAKRCNSVRTIEDHRARIMQKLGAVNAIDLAIKALALQECVWKQTENSNIWYISKCSKFALTYSVIKACNYCPVCGKQMVKKCP